MALGSQVDESLFGNNKPKEHNVAAETDIERQAARRSAKRSGGKKKRETVQVVTKDLIRNLM